MDGIEISVLKSDDYKDVKKYIFEEFLPDEPMMSSTKLVEGNNPIDRYLIVIFDNFPQNTAFSQVCTERIWTHHGQEQSQNGNQFWSS